MARRSGLFAWATRSACLRQISSRDRSAARRGGQFVEQIGAGRCDFDFFFHRDDSFKNVKHSVIFENRSAPGRADRKTTRQRTPSDGRADAGPFRRDTLFFKCLTMIKLMRHLRWTFVGKTKTLPPRRGMQMPRGKFSFVRLVKRIRHEDGKNIWIIQAEPTRRRTDPDGGVGHPAPENRPKMTLISVFRPLFGRNDRKNKCFLLYLLR